MNIGDLFMRVVADDKGFAADLNLKAKKAGDQAGGTLGKSLTASMKKAWSGQELGKGLVQGLGLAGGLGAANALAGGLSKVSDLIGQSIEDASNLNEETSKSEVIFGKNAKGIQDWAAKGAQAFGLAKRTALEAASGFAGLFATVGEGLDESTKRSQKLTELGADLASFFNTDMPTALAALKSGLSGESEPLRQFNVFLSETAVTAKLAQMGVKKTGGAFTEAQKATARYMLIMEQTSSAQGDFARTSTGLANSQRILNAELENARAKLGQELLPLQLKFTQAQRDGIPVVLGAVETVENMGKGLGFLFDKMHDVTIGWNPFASEADRAATVADEQAKRIGGSFRDMSGQVGQSGDQVTTDVEKMRSAVYGLGGQAKSTAALVVVSLDDMVDKFAKTRSELEGAASDVANAMFDPLLAKAELATIELEEKRLRNTRNAAKAGSIERKQAQDDLLEVNKRHIEVLATLASYGDTAARKTLLEMAKAAKATGTLTAEQLAYWDRLIAKIGQYNVKFAGASQHSGPGQSQARAFGGPVTAGKPYLVNENTPNTEIWVPDVSGRVLSGAFPAALATLSSPAGGPTHSWTIINPEPRAADEDIGRALRRASAMGLG